MRGNSHVRFLGGWAGAIPPGYPTITMTQPTVISRRLEHCVERLQSRDCEGALVNLFLRSIRLQRNGGQGRCGVSHTAFLEKRYSQCTALGELRSKP
jgi:hypothetical protein